LENPKKTYDRSNKNGTRVGLTSKNFTIFKLKILRHYVCASYLLTLSFVLNVRLDSHFDT